jgi:hypothetical protein
MKIGTSKIALLVIALVLVFSINVAFAAKGGDPLAVVWAAIADLQHQIDNIQLIPGPQGPKGDKGDTGNTGLVGSQGIQGVKGDKGDAGNAGKSLRVVDANGNEVGYLLSTPLPFGVGSTMEVFNSNLGVILSYSQYSGSIDGGGIDREYLIYQSDNCSGDSYANNLNHPYRLVVNGPREEAHYFKADGYTDLAENFVYGSKRHGVTATSTCETVTGTTPFAIKVHEVPEPSEIGPLRILEQ